MFISMYNTRNKTPCLNCEERYHACWDDCPKYLATKPKYKDEMNQTSAYLSDKHHRMKKTYKGRNK